MANMTRLKARGRTGKPTWRIQFYDGAGDRRAIYLGAVPKKAADVWLNRIEQLNACTIAGVATDTDLAAWVGSLPDASDERLVQVGLAEPRDSSNRGSMTVARLTEAFVERSAGKPATIRGFQQTLNSFGGVLWSRCEDRVNHSGGSRRLACLGGQRQAGQRPAKKEAYHRGQQAGGAPRRQTSQRSLTGVSLCCPLGVARE
jgi:hypothetical protein